MAKKQQIYDGFSVFMMETQQKLSEQGIKKKISDLRTYCQPKWGKVPDQEKAKYKLKAKSMTNEFKYERYTSTGENVEDIKKQYDAIKSQEINMYQFIEQLVRTQSSNHRLHKQKFIFIHINSYTCEKEKFYFPAEISMAEFSLEGGLIRIFHQLVGFDKDKTNAPQAPTADINNHAINNHKITPFMNYPDNYLDILLKIIGFIMEQDVVENMLYDLDLPPLYTANNSTNNELMITISSLYQLYQCSVNDDYLDNFDKIFRVYLLDKLFMEFKNESYNNKYPNASMTTVVPSMAIAADTLTKSNCNSIKSISCPIHDKLDEPYICSNYFVCNWIYIFSTHCCQYFNIKFVSGCHYDFDLSKLLSEIENSLKNWNISKKNDDYAKYFEPSTKTSTAISFPALGGGSSTTIQKPTWNKKPEHKTKPQGDTVKNNDNNFPPLGGNSQKIAPGNNPIKTNSWHSGSGKGIVNQAQNNAVPLSGNSKKSVKGKGVKDKGGK